MTLPSLSRSPGRTTLPKRAELQAEQHARRRVRGLDGFCIFLGGQNGGGCTSTTTSSRGEGKNPDGDYVVSDYEYIMLDTANKTIRKLPLSEAAEVTSTSGPTVPLSDSNSLLSLKYPKSPTETIAMLKRLVCRPTLAGPPTSTRLGGFSRPWFLGGPRLFVDRTRGRCDACNLKRMISHRCKLAGRTMCVGLVCKRRMDIISDLLETHKRSPAVVFLFKFLDTLHELTKLKAEASGEYAT